VIETIPIYPTMTAKMLKSYILCWRILWKRLKKLREPLSGYRSC